MLNYNWKFREIKDEKAVSNLVSSLKIPRSIANVLYSRGFVTIEEARNFFDPKLEDILDPFLMKGMDEAVDRILRAIKNQELIWIHGDYDVDGTTSTAMLLLYLREIGAKVDYHIPDRFQEGYGLTVASVAEAKAKGVSLILTVDVGITSYDALSYAKKLGMDSIVCDHHEPGEYLPDADIILDPLLPESNYPFKHLAACGVAFKLLHALSIKLNHPEKAYTYLDFVAIASAADMVPLLGENRSLVKFGLEILNKNPRPGLLGLINCTNLKLGSITTSSIIFSLAPLINAAGRLGDAGRSVEMMTETCEFQAFRMAQQLEQENRRRRYYDELTFEEAIPFADELLSKKPRKSIVIHGPKWHAGVIGIVASRLVDRYHLPTVLMTTIYNMAKGSARSINDFDIHNALKSCDYLLKEYGGHKHAAGLSLDINKVEEFSECFDEIAQKNITNEMLVPEIAIDSELNLFELTPKYIDLLNKFSPFGYNNYKPVFFSKGITSKNGIKILGNNHIKFRACQYHPDYPNNENMKFEIDAIGHNLVDKINICSNGKKFSIVYNLEESNYNGYNTIQLKIKDIRPDD
ncbi:MAG: single-stranded-DNA-specific exonuclease RecJ [Candidatus Kapabacteria bacterium]|nr:single-stranded-DNA-specific exonuclease RecJ [Candidatus Kapabacteria bacterium]